MGTTSKTSAGTSTTDKDYYFSSAFMTDLVNFRRKQDLQEDHIYAELQEDNKLEEGQHEEDR